MDEFSAKYRQREYASGKALAVKYINVHQEIKVRLFKEIAKESDWCILGFTDGIVSLTQ